MKKCVMLKDFKNVMSKRCYNIALNLVSNITSEPHWYLREQQYNG